MIIVLILIAVLATIGPFTVEKIDSNSGLLVNSVEQRAAVEAANAGVQWYENHLNIDPTYFEGTDSQNDPAIGSGNWCTSSNPACGLPGSNPQEAFQYAPYPTTLSESSGPSAGELLVSVTGRAGPANNPAYATEVAAFRRTSILGNVYFSNYELLDPSVIASYVADSGLVGDAADGYFVSVNGQSESVLVPTVSDGAQGSVHLWSALCEYYTYQPNTFIDSLGTVPTGNAQGLPAVYSPSYPYYGPYYGLSKNYSSFEIAQTGISVPNTSSLCGDEFEFISGDTFDGPVYTEDQLHTCGSPAFEGEPDSLTSGASSDLEYAYDVPGSLPVTTNGTTVYTPGGVIEDTDSGCSGTPTFKSGGNGGPVLNGDEVMPVTNAGLRDEAESGGCMYSGPTVIELVTSGSQTTMDIWSPLSSTALTTGSCGSNNGASTTGTQLSRTNPFVTGVPLPSNGVIYVTGSSAANGVSIADCVDANAPSATSGTNEISNNNDCLDGTAYVEGELSGELTIGAADNVIITHDLTYACADNQTAQPTLSSDDPSSVPGCTDVPHPDLLGLDASNDVIVARPGAGAPTCGYDGVGQPPDSSSDADGLPDCEMSNPVIDAAVVATQGSFGVQSYDLGGDDGNLTLNGTDVSNYRGPFGTFSTCQGTECVSTGYNKVFSFDSRLAYLAPPGLLDMSNANWNEVNVTNCVGVDSSGPLNGSSTPTCPGLPQT